MARRKILISKRQHISQAKLTEYLLVKGISLIIETIEENSMRGVSRKVWGSMEWKEYYPSSIVRQTTRLLRKGWAKVKETDKGCIVEITEKGRKEILDFDINNLSISVQDPWDGKWRMVIFDIAVDNEKVRKQFREYLKSMGFFQMQKSVYVNPYPCEKEVQYVREVLGIPHSVKIATLERLENDEDLRQHFGL